MNSGISAGVDKNTVSRLFITFLFTCILSIGGYSSCMASTVVLNWQPVIDADLGGYKVYYQADSSTQPFQGTGATQGVAPLDVPKDLNQTTATISGLDPYHTYYFAVTAYNNSGAESTYSDILRVPKLYPITISIGPPANGSVLSETATVSATASDNVSKVEFYAIGTDNTTTFLYATNVPPYSFNWDTTSIANGTYTLTAKAYNAANISFESSVSVIVSNIINITIPDAPIMGTATAGNAQASVTFIAPASNGGSPITGYTVTSSAGQTATGSTSPITVTGLTNGTAYTFTVKATNAVGTSPASAASNSVTPATTPGAPTIGTATAGNAQATISFTAPASNGGSAITGYTVTSSTGGIMTSGSASPITVTGLTNGTAYTFTVNATNAVGTGPSSSASNSVTPATTPGAPTIGTATAGNAQATVTFIAPASNGGSAITSYTVTSSAGQTATGSTSPITMTGLTNGTVYTFTVKATNAIGTSVSSAASNSVTPLAPSNPPSVSIITPLSGATYNASATISFTASATANGASSITKVEFYNGANLLQTVNSSPYTYTWSNVVAGTYTITAKAYDSTGSTSVSSPVTVIVTSPVRRVTFASVSPSSPRPVGTSVTFNATATGGSGNYQYLFMVKHPVSGWATVQAYSSNSSFIWSTTGMAKGTYYIQVLARNAGATVNYEASKSVKYALR